MKDIPYAVFESMVAHMERTIRRLWILCIIVIALFVGTNIAWILYENQFETVTETTTTQEVQQGGGGNNYVVGGDYGTNSKNNNDD